ncbi:heme-binding protein 1-like isoform X2 [Carcharodon carcharias]|uniref:heme-binding protein 1-like isoform X2 n=1 Tax=Carcharodon carcharias TaxID=13397 RepID=UPI001B7E3100|nr:heme-binding protein 1-like isoform X2 [Carcharodon carcharias]
MFGMITNSLFSQPENRPFQTLNSETKGDLTYEERKYEAGNYACVSISGKPFDEGSGEGALKLLKYVGGTNEQGLQLGMTSPVSMIVRPAEGDSLQPKVEVQIRIPSQFQENAPKPTDESIEIKHQDGFTVYSTQFGGYAKEANWVEYAGKLRTAMGDTASYHRDFYVCAGYDPPMKPIGRKNEVWFLKKED